MQRFSLWVMKTQHAFTVILLRAAELRSPSFGRERCRRQGSRRSECSAAVHACHWAGGSKSRWKPCVVNFQHYYSKKR